MKKILNYKKFYENKLNSEKINEGLLSFIKNSIIDKLSGWSADFYKAVGKGLIKICKKGKYKGKPIAMLFVQENGSVTKQFEEYYNTIENDEEKIEESKIPLEWPVQTVRMDEVSTTELKDLIKGLYERKLYCEEHDEGDYSPIFIYGAPGIGKTSIVAQVADELDIDMLFMDLQNYEPVDMKGVPSLIDIEKLFKGNDRYKKYITDIEKEKEKYKDSEKKPSWLKRLIQTPTSQQVTISTNVPSTFPRDNGSKGKGGIIFMDEVNRANVPVFNSLITLCDQPHRLENYEIPSKWIIVAAGNREEDDPYNSEIKPIGTTVGARFTRVNYVPTLKEWGEFLKTQKLIMPELYEFVISNGDKYFHYNDPEENKGVAAYPTPRAWTQASKAIMSVAQIKKVNHWTDLPLKEIQTLLGGKVGPQAASEYLQYIEIIKQLTPEIIEILLKDPDKAKMPEGLRTNSSALYSCISVVLSHVSKYEPEKLRNILFYFNRYGHSEKLYFYYEEIKGKFKQFDYTKVQHSGADKSAPDYKPLVDVHGLLIGHARVLNNKAN